MFCNIIGVILLLIYSLTFNIVVRLFKHFFTLFSILIYINSVKKVTNALTFIIKENYKINEIEYSFYEGSDSCFILSI